MLEMFFFCLGPFEILKQKCRCILVSSIFECRKCFQKFKYTGTIQLFIKSFLTNIKMTFESKGFNFKEILSPSKTKNQRFCHFWGQYEVYEDIISDLTYKNFLCSKTKQFLMKSQIYSKIISFLCFCSSSISISLLYPSKTQKWDYFWEYLRYHQKSFCFGI